MYLYHIVRCRKYLLNSDELKTHSPISRYSKSSGKIKHSNNLLKLHVAKTVSEACTQYYENSDGRAIHILVGGVYPGNFLKA